MTSRNPTLRGRFAAKLLRDHVTEQFNARIAHTRDLQANDIRQGLPKFGIKPPSEEGPPSDGDVEGFGKVCIVGAGASGMYLAWMLTWLGIEYDLLEASDRIGGRIFTYKGFKEDPEHNECAHNYYDVGAMRIPKIPSNQVTLDVLNYLKIPYDKYYLDNDTAPYYYDRQDFSFKAASAALDPLTAAFKEPVDGLNRNFNEEFQKIVHSGMDNISTREWLRTERYGHYAMPFKKIQRLETFDTGTGLFDQSLTESILDYADFPAGADWFRVEGGMISIIEGIDKELKTHATLNTTVRAYKMKGKKVEVTSTQGEAPAKVQEYSAVFNSTTLGALGRIELNGLGSENQLTAIRSLTYDSAAKLAIKFKTAWWITLGGMSRYGGISGTDLPTRVVAYPPWTDKDDPEKPTVIIASYTWHQDAVRMGSLINNSNQRTKSDEKPDESEALSLVLRNLETMYKSRNPEITYKFLLDQVIDYHGYAWANDPHSSGAFALFGPGQFTNLYPALFSPLLGSDNNVYIIGEHASAHHAWISGAFYSAATSLYGWLFGLGEEGQRLSQYLKFCGDLPFGGTIDDGDVIRPPKHLGGTEDDVEKFATLQQTAAVPQDRGTVPDEMDEQVLYWMAQLAKKTPTDKRLPPLHG